MELVYLWVEEYKNIKEQGFNFSGRYRCEYDKETNELTINENKEYVHIFPENINVTAIVGKNGSGKSSITTSLVEIFNVLNLNEDMIYDNLSDLKYTILVYKIKEKFSIVEITENKSKISSKNKNYQYFIFNNSKNKKLSDFLKKISLIHYDYSLNLYKKYQKINSTRVLHEFVDIETDYELYFDSTSNIQLAPDKLNQDVFNLNYEKLQIINYLLLQDKYIDVNNKYFEPYQIKIEVPTNLNGVSATIKSIMLAYLKNHEDTKKEFVKIQKLSELDDYIKQRSEKEKSFMKVKVRYYGRVPTDVTDIFKYLKFIVDKEEALDGVFSIESHQIFSKNGYTTKYYLNTNIENINAGNISLIELMPSCCFNIEIYDRNNKNYEDLSSGEKSALRIKFYIKKFIAKNQNSSFLVILDEPSNEMHPQWQKKLIDYLVKLSKNKEQEIHIILTSHSPFVLSDLPKENVIFLEDGKQVYPDINPFGANIHTLLSHGFFMEDGLIGEYAKSKINKAIELLNKKGKLSKSSMKYCEEIISIIGEPILKKQLQRMLDSKRLSKIDEIDLLKAQMSEIEKKLKKLESSK